MRFLESISYQESLPKIMTLFRRSFSREIEESFLRWRYLNNPVHDLLAAVEEQEDQIIANYSASPCILSREGEDFKTALSMTTMTDPDHTGKGLFKKLASLLYQEMLQKNYVMIWGFPNNQSHYGFVEKLGWADIHQIPTMALVLNELKIENMDWKEDNPFDLDYSKVTPPQELLHVKKMKSYLQWRYAKHPINKYKNIVIEKEGFVSSYCVVKKYNSTLDIIDFQASEKEEGILLLRQVLALASKEKLQSINCWVPSHHFLHAICEKMKFMKGKPITYFGGRVLMDHEHLKEQSKHYSNWYIQMGDSDVY